MKVAFTTFAFAEFSASLVNGLAAEAGLSVTLYIPRPLMDSLSDEIDPRIEVVQLAAPRLRQPLAQMANCAALAQHIDREGPDIVHLQQGHLWFNWFLRRLPAPLVVTVHDARHHPGDRQSRRTPQAVLNRGFRQAERLITQATAVRDELIAGGFDRERIDVIPHPAVGAVPTDVRPPNPRPTVLFFGRIWEYKGLRYLIDAAPQICEAIPDVTFVIAGEGESFAPYAALIEDPNRFQVLNRYVSDTERAQLFDDASVVVLPYIEASQSGVVPVAYAHGRPVVATRVGGLPESVDHCETGLLVAPRSADQLARAVISILADPAYRDHLGRNGRRKLNEQLSSTAVARRTVETYEAALGRVSA